MCWSNVYRRIFGFNKWESVKSFICRLGRLDFWRIRIKFVVRFYMKLYFSNNAVLQTLSQTSISHKYCHEFLNSLDVNLSLVAVANRLCHLQTFLHLLQCTCEDDTETCTCSFCLFVCLVLYFFVFFSVRFLTNKLTVCGLVTGEFCE